MNRAEAHLAAKIGVEYRQFLEKKGYFFGGELSLDSSYEGRNFTLHYEPSVDKHTVKLASPIRILHEMTHILLKKDGVEPKTYAVGGGLSRDMPETILELYRTVLVSGVPDYYVDTLMLQFLGETESGALRGWITDYFDRKRDHVQRYFSKHLPDSADWLRDRRVFDEVSIFNYFIMGLSLFFKYSDYRMRGGKPDDFEPIVKKLAKEHPHLSHFLINRYALIKNFVDKLPSYNDIKNACGNSRSPLPTARLSLRLLNILYYGVDMDDTGDVFEFAKLIRDGKTDAIGRLLQEYGLSFDRGELKDAGRLVKKMMDKDYQAFIKKCDGEKIIFSPLLI